MMTDPIRFYSKIAAYHELSNFAPFGFEADGVYWPTGRTRLPGPEVSRGGERRISRKDPGCQDTEGSEGPGADAQHRHPAGLGRGQGRHHAGRTAKEVRCGRVA